MNIQSGLPGASGPNAHGEYIDANCTITLAASATLLKGTPVCRDLTKLVGFKSTAGGGAPAANVPASGGQSDQVVLATSANAGDSYGVYQGENIVNGDSVNTLTVTIRVRRFGYGVVNAGAVFGGAAVLVGSQLIVSATNAFATVAARAIGTSIGRALATVINAALVSAVGASLIAVPGGGNTQLLINADINCL